MKRDLIAVGALWLILTGLGEAFAAVVDFYPLARSDKGEDIEQAFRALVYFAVPVMALVVAVLVYTILRQRTAGPPVEDGPPLQGRGPLPWAWFAVTAGLTLTIMIYPGLVSLPDILGDEEKPGDLVVDVVGIQWAWLLEYPQYDVKTSRELVLPVDRAVHFQITSLDVLHSFWIPGFLMKIDAVPGRTTTMALIPTETGDFQADPNLRVQCAELCGLAHAQMRIPVRVVTESEFDAWLREQAEEATPVTAGEPTPAPGAQQFTIVGRDIAFDTDEIAVQAGRPVAITFDNRDVGVPHNWALYESEGAARSRGEPLAASPIEDGPLVQQIAFDPPEPGAYYFVCDVHPNMNGNFIVR